MKNNDGRAAICIIITGCLWGTTGIFSYLFEPYGIPAEMKAFMRVLAAAVLMLPLMLRRRGLFRLTKRGLVVAVIQGIMTQTVFESAYFAAIGELGMSTAVVLLYTSPIYATIMSRILFREQVTWRKIAAIIITIIGCAFTATGGDFNVSGLSLYGIGMGLISGFCFSTLSITSAYGTKTDDSVSLTFYTFVFGLVGLTFLARPWSAQVPASDMKYWLITAACGLFSGLLPYFLFSTGSKYLKNPSMGPIYSSAENIAAAAFGVMLFGESMNAWKVCGIAMIIAAVVIGNISQTSTDSAPSSPTSPQ